MKGGNFLDDMLKTTKRIGIGTLSNASNMMGSMGMMGMMNPPMTY